MDLKTKAYGALVFGLVSGSFLPIFLALGKSVNTYEFFLLVYTFSVPTGLALVAVRGKLGKFRSLLSNKKHFAYMVITGLLTFIPIEFGIAYAEHFVTASLATAVFRTNALLVLAISPIALRERLSGKQAFALGLGVVGLYLGITSGNPLGLLHDAYLPAVALLGALTFGYSVSLVSVKKFMFDSDIFFAVSAIAMFVFFAVAFLASGATLGPVTLPDLAIIAYIGIFFNIFSFLIAYYPLKIVKTTLYTNTYLLSPFLTFVWAYLVLGEPILPYYIVIAGLVAAGIVIQRFDFSGGSYLAKKDSRLRQTVMFDVTGVFENSGEVAISEEIGRGGRVLAVKLHNDYHDRFDSFVKGSGYGNIYTDAHPKISGESKYVKEILGAGSDEFVVIKAGNVEENEEFFEKLHAELGASPEKRQQGEAKSL
ncbi:MAG: hypothetical protein QXF01_01930 [Candidatus Micrarchaeaceae archaeon]